MKSKRVIPAQVQPVVIRLRLAIEWALGVGEEFKPRKKGGGPYWWRDELEQRAGLKWDGEKFVDVYSGRVPGVLLSDV